MERSRLPIIKTNKKTSTTKSLSQVNLDTSNINYFSSKFAQLKQAYLSSNNRHMKKAHGFFSRVKGKVLNNRRKKGRKRLSK
jgi:ribosomal protein L34